MPRFTLDEFLRRLRSSNPDLSREFPDDDELRQYVLTQYPSYKSWIGEGAVKAAETDQEYDPTYKDHAKATIHNAKAMLTGMPQGTMGMLTGEHIGKEQERLKEMKSRTYDPSLGAGKSRPPDEQLQNYILNPYSNTWKHQDTGEEWASPMKPYVSPGEQQYKDRLSKAANVIDKNRRDVSDRIDKWVQDDPELQAYFKWQEDTPMSLETFRTSFGDMVGRGLSSLAPSMALSVGASLTGNPAAAFATMFGMEGSMHYNEQMKYLVDELGMDPVDASPIASQSGQVYGAVSGGLEQLGVMELMKYTGVRQQGGRAFSRYITDAILKTPKTKKGQLAKFGTEATIQNIEQALQEGSQNVADLIIGSAYTGAGIKSPEAGRWDEKLRKVVYDKDDKGVTIAPLGGEEAFNKMWDGYVQHKRVKDLSTAITDPSTKEAFLSALAGTIPISGAQFGGKYTGKEARKARRRGPYDVMEDLNAKLSMSVKGDPKTMYRAGRGEEEAYVDVAGRKRKQKEVDESIPSPPDSEEVPTERDQSDRAVILRSIEPYSEDAQEDSPESIERARVNLNLDSDASVAEYIAEQIRSGGRGALANAGIADVDAFIDNFNEDFPDYEGNIEFDLREGDQADMGDQVDQMVEAGDAADQADKLIEAQEKAEQGETGPTTTAEATDEALTGPQVEDEESELPGGREIKADLSGLGFGETPEVKEGSLQDRMTKKIVDVANPTAKKYVPKEQVKTKQATQFIGDGKKGSSTDNYRAMYEDENAANTGSYTEDDVVYVSSNGRRKGRVNPVDSQGNLTGVYQNVQKAMDAGATIVMDTAEHLSKTKTYNVGEMQLGGYLAANGYAREGLTGVWKPKSKEAQAEAEATSEATTGPTGRAAGFDLQAEKVEIQPLEEDEELGPLKKGWQVFKHQGVYNEKPGVGEVHGKPVNIKGTNRPMFIRKVGSQYTVVDARTGLGLGGKAKTIKGAIAATEAIIKDTDPAKLKELIVQGERGLDKRFPLGGPVQKQEASTSEIDSKRARVAALMNKGRRSKKENKEMSGLIKELEALIPKKTPTDPVEKRDAALSGDAEINPSPIQQTKETVTEINPETGQPFQVGKKYISSGIKLTPAEELAEAISGYSLEQLWNLKQDAKLGKQKRMIVEQMFQSRKAEASKYPAEVNRALGIIDQAKAYPDIFNEQEVEEAQDVLREYFAEKANEMEAEEQQRMDDETYGGTEIDESAPVESKEVSEARAVAKRQYEEVGKGIVSHTYVGGSTSTYGAIKTNMGEEAAAAYKEEVDKFIKIESDKILDKANESESYKEFQARRKKAGKKKTKPKNKNNDSLDEQMQAISEESLLKDNIGIGNQIISRLKKAFPAISGEGLAQVFDKFGNEVAGKAFGMAAQWSKERGGLDTPPHEYSHIYLDTLESSGNKFIIDAIKRFREGDMTDMEAKEHLAELMGKYYAKRIQQKSLKKRLEIMLRRFWLETKKFFKPLSREETELLLSERFYQGKGAGQVVGNTSVEEQYQRIAPGSLAEMKAFDIFSKAWRNLKANVRTDDGKKVKPDADTFTRLMEAQIDEVYHPAFTKWKAEYFKGNRAIQYQLTAEGGGKSTFADPETQQNNFPEDISEGLSGIDLTYNNIDVRGTGKISMRTFHQLDTILSLTNWSELHKTAKEAGSFFEWIEEAKSILNVSAKKIDDNMRQLKQYYVSQNNKVKTNREGGTGNERNNIVLNKKTKVLKRKGKQNPITNKLNSDHERKMLAEWDENKGDLKLEWLSSSDFADQYGRRTVESFNFLTYDDLIELTPLFRYRDVVPAFVRGDRGRMAFVKLTDRHINHPHSYQKNPKMIQEYWDRITITEDNKDGQVTSDQVDNFMGYNLSDEEAIAFGIKDEATMIRYQVEEIARFEAIEAYMPRMIKTKNGAKILKRLKIPFTPVMRSEEMEDVSVRHIDREAISFVTDGNVVSGMVDIEGIGRKYIGDGGTITGRTMFEKMTDALGLDPGQRRAKTVIYQNSPEGLIAVKHQHYQPSTGTEIWENHGQKNAKLVATVTSNGNLRSPNGEYFDMIMTQDEAKVLDGALGDQVKAGEAMQLKGTSVGLIKYHEGSRTVAKHPLQWYNHIRDPRLRKAFKEHYLPKIKDQIQKDVYDLWDADPKKTAKNIFNLFKKLEGDMPDGIAHNLVEKARHEMGLHPDGGGMMNVLLQTGVINEANSLSGQPGMFGDLAPNLRGDLNDGEVAIGYRDAAFVVKKYLEETKATEVPNAKTLNEWLEKNEVYGLVSRSPIPYDGGVTMLRIKRIHHRDGLVEMSPNEIFKRYEGDFDGDEVQIEMLPDELIDIYKDITDNVQVEAVNVSSHVNKMSLSEMDISSRSNLYNLMDAMNYGNKAVGEIANLQTVYGQLQDLFSFAKIDGETIRTRRPDEMNKSLSKMTMPEYLRLLIQAAVDNAEHLALKQFGYNHDSIARAMFVKEDGKPITDRQYQVLKKLVQRLKLPSKFRKGIRADMSSLRLDTALRDSGSHLEFTEDRAGVISNDVLAHTEKMKNVKDDEGNVVEVGNLEEISFKRGTSVFEDVMIALAEVDRAERQSNPERFKHTEGHPYNFTYGRQVDMHTNALANMKKLTEMIAINAAKADAEAGRDVKKEVNKGWLYLQRNGKDQDGKPIKTGMGQEYFKKLIQEFKQLGPQAVEKNDKVLAFMEKWGQEFEGLSETAQIAATYRFLEGFKVVGLKGKKEEEKLNSASLPPYGAKKKIYSLLHPEVMRIYNREYNKLVQGSEKIFDVRPQRFHEIIERICK